MQTPPTEHDSTSPADKTPMWVNLFIWIALAFVMAAPFSGIIF